HIILKVEDLPTYRCKMGRTKENLALKICEKIPRPETVKTELQLVTHKGRGRERSDI
ncbi:flagellar motor switch protein FliM, partial [Shewanella sp. 0m-11]